MQPGDAQHVDQPGARVSLAHLRRNGGHVAHHEGACHRRVRAEDSIDAAGRARAQRASKWPARGWPHDAVTDEEPASARAPFARDSGDLAFTCGATANKNCRACSTSAPGYAGMHDTTRRGVALECRTPRRITGEHASA